MLAAGIVQYKFAGEDEEGEGGEEEMTEASSTAILLLRLEIFHFLALEFLPQNTNTHTRIRN